MLVLPKDFGKDRGEIVSAGLDASGPGPYEAAVTSYVADLSDEDLEPLASPWRGVDYKTRRPHGESFHRPKSAPGASRLV